MNISHGDHTKAARDLLKAGVDIFASAETIEASGLSGHRANAIIHGKQFQLGTFIILPFELQHDVPNTGYLLYSIATKEKVAFITDSYYCRYTFTGLNVIMLECNHSYDILDANVAAGVLPVEMKKRLIKSHFSLENVKKFLKSNDLSKLQEIWLIHCSSANSDPERFKIEVQELTGKPVYVAAERS